MKLTKWSGPNNDDQGPITFSIEVTPDYNLASLTIYSPLRYPPTEAVLWESYDPVSGEAYGVAMSVPAAARGLGNLGLDPRPFLEAAAQRGWLALTDAVIRAVHYDVTIEAVAPDALRVAVQPTANPDVCFSGVLRPEAAADGAESSPDTALLNWVEAQLQRQIGAGPFWSAMHAVHRGVPLREAVRQAMEVPET